MGWNVRTELEHDLGVPRQRHAGRTSLPPVSAYEHLDAAFRRRCEPRKAHVRQRLAPSAKHVGQAGMRSRSYEHEAGWLERHQFAVAPGSGDPPFRRPPYADPSRHEHHAPDGKHLNVHAKARAEAAGAKTNHCAGGRRLEAGSSPDRVRGGRDCR